jgi:hypothetical protein
MDEMTELDEIIKLFKCWRKVTRLNHALIVDCKPMTEEESAKMVASERKARRRLEKLAKALGGPWPEFIAACGPDEYPMQGSLERAAWIYLEYTAKAKREIPF